jgi:penicillin-binding protein 1A
MPAGPSLDDRDPRGARRTGGGPTKRLTRPAARRGGGGERSGWRLWLGRAIKLGVLGVFACIASIVGMFAYYGSDPKMPNLSRLDEYRPKQVTRILDRNNVPIGELGSEKRTVVPYASIPKLFVQAVVAAEDAEYFKHGGVDITGMARAFITNVVRGRTAQGGSTITQQVIKNLLLTPERSKKRKIQEIILARRLSDKLSKEDILALYLNQIYYGHGRYGCEEAARYYFGKSVKDIDLAEASLLAGLPQSPERLSPRKHPDAAKARQRYVLGQMADHGYIDRKQAERVAAQPIRLARETGAARGLAAEEVDVVAHALADKLGESAALESSTTVTTTLDAKLQELARTSLERGLEELDARQGFRGPSGHVTGTALDGQRRALGSRYNKFLKGSEIVEAIVLRFEKDATSPKPDAAKHDTAKRDTAKPDSKIGKLYVDVGAGVPANAPRPPPATPTGKGRLAQKVKPPPLAPLPPPSREGVVDFSLEPRYAKGTKPLADRFKPGDLVRVRLAEDRPHTEEGPLPLALELGPQAAMVVLDPTTREVLALVGGYDYHVGGFDRSSRAHRQPGSAFKPVIYGAAVEAHRITPATMLNDAPEVYDLWKPQNYEKEEFRGPVRVRTALAHSINTVAIKVLSDVGLDQARAFATRVGVTSPIPPDVGLSLALGSLVVTPLELANVYATFASGGIAGQPVSIRAVGGEAQPPAVLAPTLKPEVAYVMISLMRSVVDEGTAHAAIAGKLRRPAAGKTGTSNDQRDAWFVGFTPDLLAAVWVGFDDMKKLGRGETGGKAATPIWADFMAKAMAGRPTKDFVQPPGIVVQRIDKASGLLSAAGQESGTLDEVFLDGTAPTEHAAAAGEEASPDKLLME